METMKKLAEIAEAGNKDQEYFASKVAEAYTNIGMEMEYEAMEKEADDGISVRDKERVVQNLLRRGDSGFEQFMYNDETAAAMKSERPSRWGGGAIAGIGAIPFSNAVIPHKILRVTPHTIYNRTIMEPSLVNRFSPKARIIGGALGLGLMGLGSVMNAKGIMRAQNSVLNPKGINMRFTGTDFSPEAKQKYIDEYRK